MALHCQSEYTLDSISQKCKENKKERQQIYVYVEELIGGQAIAQVLMSSW